MSTALAFRPTGTLAVVPGTAALSFFVPQEDAPEFWSADYSDKVRAEVRRWLMILSRVAAAGDARGVRVRAMQVEARLANVSFGSVRAKWYAYDQAGGDWRVLVRRSLKGSGTRQAARNDNLPPEFRQEVARRMAKNKRSRLRAYRELMVQWRRWRRHGLPEDAIPGYTTAPEPDAKGRHPHGWSYRNLVRCKAPRAEEAIEREGTTAAREFLPCIPGTRQGMRWLEYVMFDDVWRNRKICVSGLLDPCRLLQLGCLDWSTGYYLKWGLRPELPATDERKERLKKVDMLMLVAAFLAEYGYPLDYTMHLILERGTATLYAAEAKAIYDYTGGKVVCCYTEMNGQLVAAWEEKKKGNPKGKGPLESWHNLLHNWEAALSGNVGSNRDRAPAVLQAQEREARDLNTLALALSPEQRSRLQLPFPSFEQAHAETGTVIDEINRREDHACEGFDRVTWWRIKGVPMEWQPEGLLADVPGDLYDKLEYDPRVETPHQRMLRLSQGTRIAHVPGSLLRSFMEDSRVVKPIVKAAFAFSHEGRDYEYLAPGVEQAMPEGTVLTAHFSPHDMSRVHLTDEHGIFVGTWKRFGPFRRGSSEHGEAQRVRGAYLAAAVRNYQRRHVIDINAEQARMDDNLVVAAEAGLIPPPIARTLAQVEAHVAPGADRLAAAVQQQRADQRRAETARTRQNRARIIPTEAFSPAETPATDLATPTQETPAAENGEGFDAGEAIQHQPDRPPRRRILSAADFC